MARAQEPVTNNELVAANETLQEHREDVRADLAADLNGGPTDDNSESYFGDLNIDTDEAVPDGSE